MALCRSDSTHTHLPLASLTHLPNPYHQLNVHLYTFIPHGKGKLFY